MEIIDQIIVCLGHVVRVPDHLVIDAPDLAHVRLAGLVKVTHRHQGNKKVVLVPEVHDVEGLIQDHVQSLVQNHDSLVPGHVLVLNLSQGHQGIKDQDLVLAHPSKEDPLLRTREVEMLMGIMTALHETANQMLMMMEQKTMYMTRHTILFLLRLMCNNQFLLSIFFQALLLFLRRGVNFCSRAWRERNGHSSV